MALRPDLKQYLQYIVNAGFSVNKAKFDDDWEPIGPMVRAELMPTYMTEGQNQKLILTDAGREVLNG